MNRYESIPLLDHGYIRFIEAWGVGDSGEVCIDKDYECGIIEAARQSTQGSFRSWELDQKLLKYLYNNNHSTPFEFAGMVLEVQAPILVFREWQRHRTQSYNEMSARYAPLPDLYYLPTVERLMMVNNASKNKQEGNANGKELNEPDAAKWLKETQLFYERLEDHYQKGLMLGIAKELARVTMPVGHYSRMRCAANLRNWLAFLTLRMDPEAQWETRQYANAVASLIADVFPHTMNLFMAKYEREL